MERDCLAPESGQLEDLLVVEDNPGDTRLIEEAFDGAQLETTLHTVSTGENALEFLYQEGEYDDAPRPDVVLLDWSLPQMDGGEVLSEIKTDFPDVSVVVMTGSKYQKDAIEAETHRADAYLTKPTKPDVYLETVRSLDRG